MRKIQPPVDKVLLLSKAVYKSPEQHCPAEIGIPFLNVHLLNSFTVILNQRFASISLRAESSSSKSLSDVIQLTLNRIVPDGKVPRN